MARKITEHSTQFTCFYSYKGGVGRSTLLANLAIWQARRGKKVLIIDLDFEAPGQHRSGLFAGNPVEDSPLQGGFIDLCYAYKLHRQRPDDKQPIFVWQFDDYIVRSIVLDSFPRSSDKEKIGEVWLMPAGKRIDNEYDKKRNDLNWDEFFSDEIKGYILLDKIMFLCQQERFDSVLIDARTGLSDPYYMATAWMSDATVCFSLANKQSVFGCRRAMNRIVTDEFAKQYGKKRVLPVLTMLPHNLENAVQSRVNEILQSEWPEVIDFTAKINYDSYYALEEKVSALSENFGKTSVGVAVKAIDDALTDSDNGFYHNEQKEKVAFSLKPPKSPFPNLRVEYWKDEEVVSYYIHIFPRIEELLTAFQPVVVYGSRGTGKTTLARYLSYESQLVKFKQKTRKSPVPSDFPFVGLWVRLDSDFLIAFNTPKEEDQPKYNHLFGMFFDMLILRKALVALDKLGGLEQWISDSNHLFIALSGEMSKEKINEELNFERFVGILEEQLATIRAYINDPGNADEPWYFQSNTLMKLLGKHMKENIDSYFVIFVDEVENYATYQQRVLNTRVKSIKRSDKITYNLLVRNGGIKTSDTDAAGQMLEVTHDYRGFHLDEDMAFNDFYERASELFKRYLENSQQFEFLVRDKTAKEVVKTVLESLTQEEEAKQLCGQRGNKELIEHLEKKHRLAEVAPILQWFKKEPNILRQAVAVVLINQGKDENKVVEQMVKNTAKAQDWYHNYARGALFWLCRLYKKKKVYSGFRDIAGIAGNNTRIVIDICHAIFERWIEDNIQEKSSNWTMPIKAGLQNDCIHNQSKIYVKKLDRFRFEENRINRFAERLGNLFSAIHKSPRQGEPEINHFSSKGELNEETLAYLDECRRENIVRWLRSNKQKSSSDYLPDAYQLHPSYAPRFNISWRRKKKLELSCEEIEILCFKGDEVWDKIHRKVEKQYHESDLEKEEGILFDE